MVSKIQAWKKDYYALTSVLSKSGTGWNETSNMVDASDELWEEIIKTTPSTSKIRMKPFSFYNEWVDIFGKDRATGENAVDLNSDSTAMHRDAESSNNLDPLVGFETFFNVDYAQPSYTQQDTSPEFETPPTNAKKRKRISNNDEDILSTIADVVKSQTHQLESMTVKMGFEFEVAEKQRQVLEIVHNMPKKLSMKDCIKVSKLLMADEQLCVIILRFTENEQVEMVKEILEGLL